MNCQKFDIPQMSEVSPRAIAEIQRLVAELFDNTGSAQEECIEALIELISHHLNVMGNQQRVAAVAAVFFDACFSCLLSKPRQQKHGELHDFLIILNHLPILENSPFYAKTLEILSHYFRVDPTVVKLFDRLQLLYLFAEIGNLNAARNLADQLQDEVSESRISFFTLYQLCRIKVFDAESDLEAKVRTMLRLITTIFETQGSECALFMLGRWLCTIRYLKASPFYKALFCNLYEDIKAGQSLNAAMVGYEIFSLEDKQISPEDKLTLFNELMEYKESILNSKQLHSLHFFAGNYVSGRNEDFHDSIQSFKSSNYFLHKCWERLIGISGYMRMHSTPAEYKTSVAFLDKMYLDMSHQTSMRNNSYVENLQVNFDKIEELLREVGELSLRDALTGLRNRRYMENNLNQIVALAFRHNVPVSFAMIDIDHFKRVNDTLGHAAGDIVLKELSSILSEKFRKSDIIVRYGGEEFLAILFDVNPERCLSMMHTIRQNVQDHTFHYQRHKIHITISIGLYCEKLGEKPVCCDLQSFIQKADEALYEAKNSGRNTVRLHDNQKNILDI